MIKIGLISDTHSFLDEQVFRLFAPCTEIWHAGDFGTIEVAQKLNDFRPLTGVYGNIDGHEIREVYPEVQRFTRSGLNVMMTHIGGYPPKYHPGIVKLLRDDPPQLFICGHSHILKIMFDQKLKCLHMNPGAAGKQGWHTMRTVIRFDIDDGHVKNCEVIELGPRTAKI
ncbi:MAG: metallophosphoesterase [Chitinophagaceae bacterium]|nr:MAG: metallophosphoesterase [Chitinophagaceae bacterium]